MGLGDLSNVVTQSSAPAQIVDHIVSAISVGALAPGAALPPERVLAQSLGVSRSSVRAALDTLGGLGLVVRKRGRGGGTFVADLPQDLAGHSERIAQFQTAQRDLLEARAVVHGRLAALAATQVTDGQVGRLRALQVAYEDAREPVQSRTCDYAFHHEIAQLAGNAVLVGVVQDLDTHINVGFRHDPYSQTLHTQACRDHAAIVDALEAGDADTAGRVCEQHFRATTMAVMRAQLALS